MIERRRTRSATFEVEGLSDTFWVVGFDGSEELSTPFEYEVQLVARHVDVSALVGRFARLEVLELAEPRIVHGMILRAEYAGERFPRALYRITLVPWIHCLLMRTDCRIFADKTTPEIVTAVLADLDIDKTWYRFELHGDYVRRVHCTQYRESDLNFIHRLLEDEGIFYYFEHSEHRHVLVFTDREGGGPMIPGDPVLEYRERQGNAPSEEHVKHFRVAEELRPEQVAMRGVHPYDPAESRLHFHHEKAASGADRAARERGLQLYDFPGELHNEEDAVRLVRHELAAIRTARRRGLGTSDCPRLAPGLGFTLADHPLKELDGEYSIIRVHHVGAHPDTLDPSAEHALVYSNEFVCIPRDHVYRAPRVTPRPTVRGVHAATVVGDGEVHTDEYGRIKVHFHWDRNDNLDGTCWVPVSQAWAGNGFGALFLPRCGDKVLVEFIEGNPDRPVVVGRLHYTMAPTPVLLPDYRSRSTIRTQSFGGSGFHEIRFEDQAGAEQLFIHAERDMDAHVRNDRRESVGHDEHRTIHNDRFERVGHDQHTAVGGDAITKIAGQAGAHTGSLQLQVDGAAILGVGGDRHDSVSGSQSTRIGGDHHQSTGGSMVHTIGGPANIEARGPVYFKGATVVIEAEAALTLKCGAGFVTIDPSGVSIVGPMINLNSGGAPLVGVPASATPPKQPKIPDPTAPTPAESDS